MKSLKIDLNMDTLCLYPSFQALSENYFRHRNDMYDVGTYVRHHIWVKIMRTMDGWRFNGWIGTP